MENTLIDPYPIRNRVAGSGLVTLDLADHCPPGKRVAYDIKDNLYEGVILKEKEFRQFIRSNDWSVYDGSNVAIYCSQDAIIPTWAYMLLVGAMEPYANKIIFGSLEALEQALFQEALSKINMDLYRNAKVVVKGCGENKVPVNAYVEITKLLLPVVQGLMYGEPCSTVPIFKKDKPFRF